MNRELSKLFDRVIYRLRGPAAQVSKDKALRRKIDWMHRHGIGLSPAVYAFQTAKLLELLPTPLIALDPFGMCGLRKTVDFADDCDSLDLFEINAFFAAEAKRNLPTANVHVSDSIIAAQTDTLPRSDYSLLFVDNPTELYGEYCEHFELFPSIYRSLAADCLLIMNVQLDDWIDPTNQEQIRRRSEFYGGPMANARQALEFYAALAEKAGYAVDFETATPHPGNMFFLLQRLKRHGSSKP